MADKNKPGSGNNGGFDEDDPFAELARLIGTSDNEQPRRQEGSYQPETADDLTDELLREFDSFSSHAERSDPPIGDEAEPYFAPDENDRYQEPQPFEPDEAPASIWDSMPAEPAPEEEQPDDFGHFEMRGALGGYEPQEPRQADEAPGIDEPVASPPPYDPEPTYPPEPEYEPESAYQPEPYYEPEPAFEPEPQQPTAHEDHELDLDLDELALELSELELAEDDGPGPLDEVAAGDDDSDGDFDPAALISTEEPPAPVDELDLPPMGDDEVVPVRASAEPYEFDLDEELADVLASQPALVDPLQEAPAQPDPSEELDYYAAAQNEAYDEPLRQAVPPQAGYDDPADGFQNADDDYYDFDDRERRPGLLPSTFLGAGRVVLIGIGAIVLAVLFVFAGMRYFAGDSGGEPVVITADNSSVKEAPEDPGGEVVPNQDNAVFNDVSGTLAEPPRQGSLIASDQQPTDVESVAPNPLAGSASGGTGDTGGLEPRKVRTMIVRPDGTLVERDAAQLSPSSSTGIRRIETQTALPDETGQLVTSVPQDSVNAGSGGETAAPSLAPPSSQATETPPVSATPEDTAISPVTEPSTVAEAAAANTAEATEEPEQPAAQDAPVQDFGIANVPLPTRRPPGGAPARVAAASPAPATTAPAAAAPAAAAPQASAQSTSAYAMQIASLPSVEEAQQAYRRLSAQHPSVLGRRPVEIVPATIAGKGTFYRVRIGASSLSEALSLCERYKAEGGSCFVPR